jgi:tRNA (cmo5U34)-methyltransferase
MTEFDLKAAGWDRNQMHWDRSAAIVNSLLEQIPVNIDMAALEFGAGTGITSFLLKDHLKKITMMDNSPEMVRIMNDKVRETEATNLGAVCFDLEKKSWKGEKFDLIISQMVLHHITDIENIIDKFSNMLNPGGFLAIADLYPEDGSFHGDGFAGHRGFDTRELSDLIQKKGFGNISSRKCYVINKKITETDIKQFDVFLLTATRLPVIPVLKGR